MMIYIAGLLCVALGLLGSSYYLYHKEANKWYLIFMALGAFLMIFALSWFVLYQLNN